MLSDEETYNYIRAAKEGDAAAKEAPTAELLGRRDCSPATVSMFADAAQTNGSLGLPQRAAISEGRR